LTTSHYLRRKPSPRKHIPRLPAPRQTRRGYVALPSVHVGGGWMDMSTSTLPFCQLGSRLSMKKMASLRQRSAPSGMRLPHASCLLFQLSGLGASLVPSQLRAVDVWRRRGRGQKPSNMSPIEVGRVIRASGRGPIRWGPGEERRGRELASRDGSDAGRTFGLVRAKIDS